MVGRKGHESVLYEMTFALLFLGLFALAAFPYIIANSNGDSFWSKFYAIDVATAADTVAAGYGDVVLRYDNIKEYNKVSFWFQQGKVIAFPGIAAAEIPSGASIAYYGKDNFIGEPFVRQPKFLLLRKINNQLSITSDDALLQTCPTATISTVAIDATEDIQAAVKNTVAGAVIIDPVSSYRITVQRVAGTANTLSFAPTDKDGVAIACNFAQHLASLSPISFTLLPPPSGGNGLHLTITTTNDATLTSEQIGKAIGRALVLQ